MKKHSVLAVFLRDEEREITWWIAWHLAIGFSTLIIYDDNSADKTREIVKSSGKLFDVRLRSAQKALRFNHRQKFTYEHAIQDAQNEFEWMMFLDSDEYLDVHPLPSLKSFIDNIQDKEAIAINWRCYGSNNYINKPPCSSPFDSYVYGSRPNSMEANKIVKSLFKLSQTKFSYINPHRFAVDGRYVTSDGQTMIWDALHPERTLSDPNWINAKIRHYACRSLEDFVAKVGRRSDIRDSSKPLDYFLGFDVNEEYDPVDPIIGQKAWDIAFAIRTQHEKEIYSSANKFLLWERKRLTRKFQVFEMTTIHNGKIVLDSFSRKVSNLFPNAENDTHIDIFGVVFEGQDNIVYLIPSDLNYRIALNYDDRTGIAVPFYREPIENSEARLGLRNPHSGRSVCWLPAPSPDQLGYGEANRQWMHEWEAVTFSESKGYPDHINAIAARLTELHANGIPQEMDSDFNVHLSTSFLWSLPHTEQVKWEQNSGRSLPSWIKNSCDIIL